MLYYRHVIVYILLASVLDTDVTVSQRDLLIFENVSSIITAIHNVDFGQATD